MNNGSRLGKSLLNLFSGFAYRLIIMLTAFVVRTVFIRCLSDDYLGINGLYGNILSMLSLAELGFGTAMVYSMYLPLANNDHSKLAQLTQLYKKVYRIIGVVVLLIGLALVPFLDVLIRNKPDVEGLTFYYLLFLGDSVASYWFFAYRNSILQADQKAYIISGVQGVFNLIKSLTQIVILLLFRNYTLYLLTQIGCTLLQNCALAVITQRHYPVFRRRVAPLPEEEQNRIFQDVGALALSKISFVMLNSTDSLIISAFVGLEWVGLLSNFSMIVEAITGVLSQIIGAISASMGNFFAKEDSESSYKLFRHVDFMNFWLYGFCAIALLILLNPFVKLWLGTEYTLSWFIVSALVGRFFVAGIMNMFSTFRSSLGLFVQGKYRPLAAAGMNIVLSVALSKYWGAAGVLLATVITRLCINLWHSPLVIHRDGFERSVKPYYLVWFWRLLILVGTACLLIIISDYVFINGVTYVNFALMVGFVAVIPNLIFLLCFYRSEDCRYFMTLMKSVVHRIIPAPKGK